MDNKRKVEIFSAGCPACEETIQMVNKLSCPSCEVSVLNMNEADVAARAQTLGIRSVPAILIDGKPDRKSTRLNSSHIPLSRMPSSA